MSNDPKKTGTTRDSVLSKEATPADQASLNKASEPAEAAPPAEERRRTRRILGRVTQCSGMHASIIAYTDDEDTELIEQWAVGVIISINLGSTRTVGLVTRIQHSLVGASERPAIESQVELIGEIREDSETRIATFDRGVSVYPHIGSIAHRIRRTDLEAVYATGGRRSMQVGHLSQAPDIEARIAVEATLSRHFAVFGTTGVGKSSAVALMVRRMVDALPDQRILIFDPHNEYYNAFKDLAIRLDARELELPYWLFKLDELCEVVFHERNAAHDEVELLRDLIPTAKRRFRQPAGSALLKRGDDDLTPDTPVPYRFTELLNLIDERIGMLDQKLERPALRSLRTRLESVLTDPRFRFMFSSVSSDDDLPGIIGKLFRIPMNGRPITCFEMAGLPPEVTNAVCAVMSRVAFDLCMQSSGKLKLLIVCEEAHRYVPSDQQLGFAPTRQAIARIAKEGRKYGCYLGVVTQRPGELDPTVLSQCSTIFTMRLANEKDQEIIRKALGEASSSTLSFLSSMGQRESIAFGEGVATTMRFKFDILAAEHMPAMRQEETSAPDAAFDLASAIDNMRNLGKKEGSRRGLTGGSTQQPENDTFAPHVVPVSQAWPEPESRPTLRRQVASGHLAVTRQQVTPTQAEVPTQDQVPEEPAWPRRESEASELPPQSQPTPPIRRSVPAQPIEPEPYPEPDRHYAPPASAGSFPSRTDREVLFGKLARKEWPKR
ncbi:ATP-binding protein [Limoniibacter endophyticus]|uniref:Helicase HerA central domain-containing protein n=1 Tax=Limoniibacter endophyticus TaxID=1565040 RepID=A0A8J3GI80_9HYPH|nr:ATP-binding protein [Limoniibacter endophyticus]GHC75393.1 hypothetical protein GCM10010136_25210 [Limoniibacter endophyticus]